ncbi:tyrosine-protein phosphatase non-receptor type 11-like isoform X2 [Epargyreus clarus]
MSAKEAEHLIMEKGRNGSFLVRESQTHPGEYVLSVRVRGRVSHVMIRRQQNKYDVGSGEQFDDLVGLIEHFRSYPMIETSGDVLRLLQPVSGTRIRAHDIDQKVQEMEEFQKPECKSGFDGEFHSLKIVDDIPVFTTNEGMKIENASKNRYRNILPYDQTRVILRGSNDPPESDYINASYIRSPRLSDSSSSVQSSNESLDSVHSLVLRSESKKPAPLVSKSLSDDALREVKRCIKMDKLNGNLFRNVIKDKVYIATQGCLPNTVADFWRMIWQEDVRVIAMITNEVEKEKKKCERYWPQPRQDERYGDILVKFISETYYEDYLLREFDICDDRNTCKTVFQYQFTAWPDHSAPTEAENVLAFLDDINRKMIQISQERDAPDQNVLCVHCSAGVGRTGTFIVLDMLIDKIKRSGFNCDIDVHSTVKMVRAQRCGMVQNKAQYRFLYMGLQTYIDNKNMKMRKRVYMSDA